MLFKDLISVDPLLQALEEMGFVKPTPVQEKAIPAALAGNDLKVTAQTGTGKTAAFMLPALSRVAKPSQKRPSILILVPTRELALQIEAETLKFSRHMPHVKSVVIFGGVPYPIQNKKLSKHYSILIATPGRLLDHIERNRIDLSGVEMLIVDEADRMLDMGFIEPVEEIAAMTPANRQTLLFSATFGKKIALLAKRLLKDPLDINIEKHVETAALIEQFFIDTPNLKEKYRRLEKILSDTDVDQAIVFSSTKIQCDEIADRLCDAGFAAAALHGDMNQNARTKTMSRLRLGKVQILVATDVAARGIDVLTISHVINFDLPRCLDDYTHRIGRTGRGGAKGKALSFVSARDQRIGKELKKIHKVKVTA